MKITLQTVPNLVRAILKAVRRFLNHDAVIASSDVIHEREDRCRKCPNFDDHQCSICTCYVGLKVMIASEGCPIGRWRPQTRLRTGL